jgi:hypothetical protein
MPELHQFSGFVDRKFDQFGLQALDYRTEDASGSCLGKCGLALLRGVV